MYEVHCEDIIETLVQRAKNVYNKLVNQMNVNHRDANLA